MDKFTWSCLFTAQHIKMLDYFLLKKKHRIIPDNSFNRTIPTRSEYVKGLVVTFNQNIRYT